MGKIIEIKSRLPVKEADTSEGGPATQERNVPGSNSFPEIQRQASILLESIRGLNNSLNINPGDTEAATARARQVNSIQGLRDHLEAAQIGGEDGGPVDWLMGENSREINNLVVAMTMEIDRYDREQEGKQRAVQAQTAAEIQVVRSAIANPDTKDNVKTPEVFRDEIFSREVKARLEAFLTSGPYTSKQAETALAKLIRDLNTDFQTQRPGLVSARDHQPFGPVFAVMIQERKWFGLSKDGQAINTKFQLMSDEGLHTVSLEAVNREAQALWGVRSL